MNAYEENERHLDEVFDDHLRNYDRRGALEYIDGVAERRPWDARLKGCQAFGRLVNGRIFPARIKAQEALALSPSNDWANAVMFVLLPKVDWQDPSDEALWIARCLDEVWVVRFYCLGFVYEATDLCRYLFTYGEETRRRRVVEDMAEVWMTDPYIRNLLGTR